MVDFKLIEIRPKIFLMLFSNQYDACMSFLRYQEFYESPSSKFRGKAFKLLDFMKWYSEKYGNGSFTYTVDWAGFNLLGSIIKRVHDLGIEDFNDYDKTMFEVYEECKAKSGDGFYLIGASKGDEATIRHEIAHGFFQTNDSYKKEACRLVNNLDSDFKQKMKETLKSLGYASNVYVDEIQAYLSTGLTDSFEIKLIGEDKPFIDLFNKYYV